MAKRRFKDGGKVERKDADDEPQMLMSRRKAIVRAVEERDPKALGDVSDESIRRAFKESEILRRRGQPDDYDKYAAGGQVKPRGVGCAMRGYGCGGRVKK